MKLIIIHPLTLIVMFFAQQSMAQQKQQSPVVVNNNLQAPFEIIDCLQPVVYPPSSDNGNMAAIKHGQFGVVIKGGSPRLKPLMTNRTTWSRPAKGVHRGENNQELAPEKLIPVLLSAIQHQQLEIDTLKKQLSRLGTEQTHAQVK